MSDILEKRNIPHLKTNKEIEFQKELYRIWSNELARWSDFIDTITKDPTISTYKGYTVNHSCEHNIHDCDIIISKDLRISFSHNPKVKYIAYQHVFGSDYCNIGAICKYEDQYGLSIYERNIFHSSISLNTNTLFETILLYTFSFSIILYPEIHASVLKELSKTLNEKFGIELTDGEKKYIPNLDLLVAEYLNAKDEFLCECSKEG